MVLAIYHCLTDSADIDDQLLFDRDFIFGKSSADITEDECLGVFQAVGVTFAQDLQTGRIRLYANGYLFLPDDLRSGDAEGFVDEFWWNAGRLYKNLP